ncbi:MAG: LURP-one-related family protein [Clostridia bacterium]|nr:LURP-one-related family protein [Clostridia bacterium]
MSLFVNQKTFSWTEKFSIIDEEANCKYNACGELFSWGKKMHIIGADGKDVALIQYSVIAFKPKFAIYVKDKLICEISRHPSIFKPKYSLQHTDWSVEGDVWAQEFTIMEGGKEIAAVKKKRTCWGDGYLIDYASPNDELPVLAMSIAIWCIIALETETNTDGIFK